jgi:hypothetical protein
MPTPYTDEVDLKRDVRELVETHSGLGEGKVVWGVRGQKLGTSIALYTLTLNSDAFDTQDGDSGAEDFVIQATLSAKRPSITDKAARLMRTGMHNKTLRNFHRVTVRHRTEFTEPRNNTHNKILELTFTYNIA